MSAGRLGATRALFGGAAVAIGAALMAPGMASAAATKPTITIGATNFPEQAIVANAYADVLEHIGYPVQVKANLGTRSVVEPALAHGQLDIEPDYAGTLLLFLNAKDTKAADQLTTAVADLKKELAPSGATVLNPAPAIDSNVFVVTKATARKDHLTTVSSLKKYAKNMVLGGPTECPTRPTCLLGLEHVYGLHFLSFKSLDEAGPISVAALKQGQVQVVELFSSDGNVVQNGFVALTDNKHLQPADHVIPVIRKSVDTPQVAAALNKLSAKLTTTQLSKLNIEVNDQNESPATVAQQWVSAEGLV
jgi:osmoprotectant transport system substrate-binding protein